MQTITFNNFSRANLTHKYIFFLKRQQTLPYHLHGSDTFGRYGASFIPSKHFASTCVKANRG